MWNKVDFKEINHRNYNQHILIKQPYIVKTRLSFRSANFYNMIIRVWCEWWLNDVFLFQSCLWDASNNWKYLSRHYFCEWKTSFLSWRTHRTTGIHGKAYLEWNSLSRPVCKKYLRKYPIDVRTKNVFKINNRLFSILLEEKFKKIYGFSHS